MKITFEVDGLTARVEVAAETGQTVWQEMVAVDVTKGITGWRSSFGPLLENGMVFEGFGVWVQASKLPGEFLPDQPTVREA